MCWVGVAAEYKNISHRGGRTTRYDLHLLSHTYRVLTHLSVQAEWRHKNQHFSRTNYPIYKAVSETRLRTRVLSTVFADVSTVQAT